MNLGINFSLSNAQTDVSICHKQSGSPAVGDLQPLWSSLTTEWSVDIQKIQSH